MRSPELPWRLTIEDKRALSKDAIRQKERRQINVEIRNHRRQIALLANRLADLGFSADYYL